MATSRTNVIIIEDNTEVTPLSFTTNQNGGYQNGGKRSGPFGFEFNEDCFVQYLLPIMPSANFMKYVMRGLFLFQATTQLYVTLTYLVPYIFSDLGEGGVYFMKVLACYFCVMGVGNWFCVICYR